MVYETKHDIVNVFITMLLQKYDSYIIAELVKFGCAVKGVGYKNSLYPTSPGNNEPSCLLGLNISFPVHKSLKEIYDIINHIVKSNNMKVFSVVILGINEMMWCGSNFIFEQRSKTDVSKIDHLKLVKPESTDYEK